VVAAEQPLVDQKPPQRDVIDLPAFAQGPQHHVHLTLRKPPAGLEGLGQILEHHPAPRPLRRKPNQPTIPNERAQQPVQIAIGHTRHVNPGRVTCAPMIHNASVPRPTRYIALLRGINVGGHARVPMAALRATCESIGCTGVATYIQSGNVVLASPLPAVKLRTELEAAIAEQIGVSPVVVIRTGDQITDVIGGNPFPDADPGHLHVAFLSEAPDEAQVAGLAGHGCEPEDLVARGADVYFYLPNGMGRAALPEVFGRRIKIPATFRNWRTVKKLAQMAVE
jgi:uncharacterized protein (DUF1697 family)